MQTDMSPAENAQAIDLSSTDATGFKSRALVVGVAGTVKADYAGSGTGVTLTYPAGIWLVAVTKIYKIGTAATSLGVLW